KHLAAHESIQNSHLLLITAFRATRSLGNVFVLYDLVQGISFWVRTITAASADILPGRQLFRWKLHEGAARNAAPFLPCHML
ncbi:MAG: hypothetical protein QN189_03375, partial [Armatimonadota bacterium]|nr:hypothetical protein [Armatimonadota bacterium]